MPNILFIGISKVGAQKIMFRLVMQMPETEEESVYKAYPKDAPIYAKTGKPAPYILVRDTDIVRARKIKDALKRTDSALDVEAQQIEFYEGDGSEIKPEFR